MAFQVIRGIRVISILVVCNNLCCRAISPRHTTWATSIWLGHSPVAMQPKTPHSWVSPVVSLSGSADEEEGSC